MVAVTSLSQLTYQLKPMDMDPVDWMIDSTPLLGDFDAIRAQMDEHGYLYLPGYLGRERVLNARRTICQRLSDLGLLDPTADLMDAIPHPIDFNNNFSGGVLDQMFNDPSAIDDVLYAGPMMAFFREFLSAEVRHYDFTWMRQVKPGPATLIHSDVVYMGRGTHQLYTAWTPMGDNTFELGGLMTLAGSHKHDGLRKQYWKHDVDAHCENKPDQRDAWQKKRRGGALHGHANQLQRSLGGKWVTSNFSAGDVVIFNVFTVHGGTDNHSKSLRLSTDTRYQRASEAVDERWIGEKPPAHGPDGKRGMIC
ncbi:phytanoyl-CoA dioxygenase family protein [soil metagenome]